ncbi:hypothetical protein GDO81_015170 [Engystomops pustulosus]|uniref:Uncharacterized protein n=1 Tax=Engystomops pustulosus TaxID=76066 RepID=A0AAV7AH77_ENGPU|nr:hypothetical protein GDO81_015170 [Engystomops pustulosus]
MLLTYCTPLCYLLESLNIKTNSIYCIHLYSLNTVFYPNLPFLDMVSSGKGHLTFPWRSEVVSDLSLIKGLLRRLFLVFESQTGYRIS